MPKGQKSPEALVALEPVGRKPGFPGKAFHLSQNLVSLFLLEKAGLHVNDLVKGAGHMKAESKLVFCAASPPLASPIKGEERVGARFPLPLRTEVEARRGLSANSSPLMGGFPKSSLPLGGGRVRVGVEMGGAGGGGGWGSQGRSEKENSILFR